MDADLSHDPLEIPKIMDHLDKFPLLLAPDIHLVENVK